MGWELSRTKPIPTFCQPRSPNLSANGAGERRPVVCPGRQGFREQWTQSLISVTVGLACVHVLSEYLSNTYHVLDGEQGQAAVLVQLPFCRVETGNS